MVNNKDKQDISFDDYDTSERLQLEKECNKHNTCEECRWVLKGVEWWNGEEEWWFPDAIAGCSLTWDNYTEYLRKVL